MYTCQICISLQFPALSGEFINSIRYHQLKTQNPFYKIGFLLNIEPIGSIDTWDGVCKFLKFLSGVKEQILVAEFPNSTIV